MIFYCPSRIWLKMIKKSEDSLCLCITWSQWPCTHCKTLLREKLITLAELPALLFTSLKFSEVCKLHPSYPICVCVYGDSRCLSTLKFNVCMR